MIVQEQIQQLNLVNDSFNPSEARDIAHSIIDNQINFYKLNKLQKWVGDHSVDLGDCDYKIAQLDRKKLELREMIFEAKEEGLEIEIDITFELKIN